MTICIRIASGEGRSVPYASNRTEQIVRGQGGPPRTFYDVWSTIGRKWRSAIYQSMGGDGYGPLCTSSDDGSAIGGEVAVRYVLFQTVRVLLEGGGGLLRVKLHRNSVREKENGSVTFQTALN